MKNKIAPRGRYGNYVLYRMRGEDLSIVFALREEGGSTSINSYYMT